jgi:hypothetical protein
MDQDDHTSFGVFKPVGHVVISFPGARQAEDTTDALRQAGVDAVQHITDHEMVERATRDMERASGLAAVGQELNLVRAHRQLAERGYHFLVVKTPKDELAVQVADIAKARGAERAQLYGNFIIEELIEHPDDLQRVSDTPDRGLDAQTPSGHEAERAERSDDGDPPAGR